MYKVVEQSEWGHEGVTNMGMVMGYYISNHKTEIWRMFQMEDSKRGLGMCMDNWRFRRVLEKGIFIEEQLRELIDWEIKDLEASFIYYSGVCSKLQRWVDNNADDVFHIEVEDLVFYIGEILRGIAAVDSLLDHSFGSTRGAIISALNDVDIEVDEDLGGPLKE